MCKPTSSESSWQRLGRYLNLFLRKNGSRQRERGGGRRKGEEESLRRETLRASRITGRSSFWRYAWRRMPLPPSSVDWYDRYITRICIRMYVSERVYGLRHRRHILNVNTSRSIHWPVNRVTRSKSKWKATWWPIIIVRIYYGGAIPDAGDVTSARGFIVVKESLEMGSIDAEWTAIKMVMNKERFQSRKNMLWL